MEDKDKEEYFLEHQQCGGSGLLSISVKMMSRTIWKRSQSRGPRPKIEEKEKLNYILRRLGDLSICLWCECLQNAVFGCIHIAWCSHSQTRQYSKTGRAKTGSEQQAEFCRPLAAVHSLDQVLLKRRKRRTKLLNWNRPHKQRPHLQGPNQPPYQICDVLISELWVWSFSQPMCSLGKGAFARAHFVFSCRFARAHKVAASHADLETLPCFESVCRSIATPPRKIY